MKNSFSNQIQETERSKEKEHGKGMHLFDDPVFLKRFRDGDEKVMKAVYQTYFDKVSGFLYRGFSFNSGDDACFFRGYHCNSDIMDTIQKTFIKAFSNSARKSYDGKRPYINYLLTVAKNVVIDEYRKKSLKNGSETDERELFVKNREEFERNSSDKVFFSSELSELVKKFISLLDQDEKNIVRVRFEERESQERTADILGLSRMNVRTLEKKIREKALKFFEKSGYLTSESDRVSFLIFFQISGEI